MPRPAPVMIAVFPSSNLSTLRLPKRFLIFILVASRVYHILLQLRYSGIKVKTEGLFMRGVVLAGGLGTRLGSLTKIHNKHLLPVYHQPMIYYPIQTLVQAGITEILIVTGGHGAGDF